MLSFSGSLKVFVAVEACDLRKSFNGLHALVTERRKQRGMGRAVGPCGDFMGHFLWLAP